MLVTVYMPTKGRPEAAFRAAVSVLDQSYSDIELIVVDDGSSDQQFRALDDLISKYPNASLIRNDRTAGACGARNSAIIRARGKFITGIDDDDVFLPHRISELVAAYEKYGTSLCTNYVEVNEENCGRRELILCGPGEIVPEELFTANVVGNQIFALKEDFLCAGIFDEHQVCWQDYDLWIRFLVSGQRIRKIDSFSYQINVGNKRARITNDPERAKGILRFIEKHSVHMSKRQILGHWLSYYERGGSGLSIGRLTLLVKNGLIKLLLKKMAKRFFPNVVTHISFKK